MALVHARPQGDGAPAPLENAGSESASPSARPYAYSYADDDATSTFVCKGRCDYRIAFGLTPTG
jgi:hypothetical protein